MQDCIHMNGTVLKESSLGKMEKGKGGMRLLLFATQTLCVFFLFHLLYIEHLTFKPTPSQQIKSRQILSEWKVDHMSMVVKKDDQHRSLEYILARLVRGEDRTNIDSTGFACDNSSRQSLHCVATKHVKIDMNTMHVHLEPSTSVHNATTVVRPYAMKGNPYVMNDITPVTITTTEPSRPTCDHNHQHPAVIFSSGGYTGNLFHEFNENLIPLFITSRLFKSRVHFIVLDYKLSFIRKYMRVFSLLSDHEIINPAVDSSVHCFPGAVIGLKFHKYLGINTSDNPRDHVSMPEFREFIRRAYLLKTQSVFDVLATSNPSTLLLISRQTTRKFLNEAEMVKMMEELGFLVIIARSGNEMSNIEKFSRVVNSCSVMVGVHGAGLANEIFLPDGAVMVQVRPLGFQWDVDYFYSKPGPGMGLRYLEYMMEPEESSLVDTYGLDHPVLQDTASVSAKGGCDAAREMYLDKQDLRLNLSRFRETPIQALRFVGRDANVANV